MPTIIERLDATVQMMVDMSVEVCHICGGSGAPCYACEGTGTLTPKTTHPSIVANVLMSAVIGMHEHQQRGDLGTLDIMLAWCLRFAHEAQAAAIQELANRGVSPEDALSAITDKLKEGNERRHADRDTTPNIGALTPEEIKKLEEDDS